MTPLSPKVLIPVPNTPLLISSLPATASKKQLKLSLVLPTYNERENISRVIEILVNLLDLVIPGEYELIVVDDHSPDRTWELALNLTNQYPQLRVMRRSGNRGLATAIIRGWQISQGEVLGVVDADLQHPLVIVTQLLTAMEKGADLAVASRHVTGGGVSEWSLGRRFLSRGAQTLGLLVLPEVVSRLSDPLSGYFMISRQAIAQTLLSPVGYKILLEVVARGKIQKITEIGYVFAERREGKSKVTWKQYLEYLQHLIRLRVFISRRFFSFCLVGIGGVILDMTLLYLLSDSQTLNLPLNWSKLIAAEAGVIHNFFWNDAWTFRDIAKLQPGKRNKLKRLCKFNFVCLTGIIIGVVILQLLYHLLGFNSLSAGKYLANLLAIASVTFWNFWLHSKLSWRLKPSK